MTKLIEIKNLSGGFQTNNGFSPVLHGVDLTIAPQQTFALVGESGSGKSVTAFAVLQLFGNSRFQATGEIIFNGQELLGLEEEKLRQLRGRDIAMIFQEPMTSLNPVYPIASQLMEPLLLHRNMTKAEAEKEALYLLERTGIPEPKRRLSDFPHQLSGGQRQRVMIAMALACRPKLLIADEPTTALDVTIQAQILTLLAELQEEMKMAILLITHDLNMVRSFSDEVAIMRQGKIVEEGKVADIFAAPGQEYTRELLHAIPKGEQVKRPGAELFRINDLHCGFPITKGFFKRKVGEVKAVNGVSLTIREGTTYGIVGESGSGKSTLGLCLLRLLDSSGELFFRQDDLRKPQGAELRDLRKEIQMVFQDPFSSLSPRLTVGEIIAEGLQVHGIGNKGERQQRVDEALAEVGLTAEMAKRYPHEFSGGQRQRIAIARVVALKPKFIVLDEPTSALDMTIQAQIIKLLQAIQQRYNIAYLFISHDLRVVRALADEIAVMKEGEIVEQGTGQEIFNNPQHPYTRKLFAAAFGRESNSKAEGC